MSHKRPLEDTQVADLDALLERAADKFAEKVDVKLERFQQKLEKRMDENEKKNEEKLERRCKELEDRMGNMEKASTSGGRSIAASATGFVVKNKEGDFAPSRIEAKGFCNFGEEQSKGLTRLEVKEWVRKLKDKMGDKANEIDFKEPAPRIINGKFFLQLQGDANKKDRCWKLKELAEEKTRGQDDMATHGKLPYFVIEPAPWRKEKTGMMGKMMGVLTNQGIPKPKLMPNWNATAVYHKDQQYIFGRPELLATLGNDNEWSIKSESLAKVLPTLTPENLMAEV